MLMFVVGFCVVSGCCQTLTEGNLCYAPKFIAPYGAYFVKPGMTREGRLQDFSSCGAGNSLEFCQTVERQPQVFAACKARCILNTCFTKKQIEKENANTVIMPGKVVNGKIIPKRIIDGNVILLKRLESCMESKGYHRVPLGECEGDQEYYAQCMWP
jgi:hypothetical protein